MRAAKARLAVVLAILAVAAWAALGTSTAAAPTAGAPASFFGIAPQTSLTEDDVAYMRAARIGAVRWPLAWSDVQPTPRDGYEWAAFDEVVSVAARQRLRVLPFAYSTPSWLAARYTVLPVANARQRQAWSAFLQAAVERYGPSGDFWDEHGAESEEPLPRVPIVDWQVWNEPNFFYFATPASPTRYARLLKLSDGAIGRADARAEIVLAGLFAEPTARPPHAMTAVDFLERLYRVPGIEARFEGVALHPYAEDAATLATMTEAVRDTIVENRDAGARLYVTEMGWGSQNNPNLVSFEQGTGFQIREMKLAYAYLIANRGRLNLKGTYWFTWKDMPESCNFCDSTGFFRHGERLKPKPAWHAFVRITDGAPRP